MNDKAPGRGGSAGQLWQGRHRDPTELTEEAQAIETAYASKTGLLESLGLQRPQRLSFEEIVRTSAFGAVVDGLPRHRCQCAECVRWRRRWAA
jgi:hypothetical protein